MIESKELAEIIRDAIAETEERMLKKQLAARLGYSRHSVYNALRGHFTEPILLRFAFIFPRLKQNSTFITIIKRIRESH